MKPSLRIVVFLLALLTSVVAFSQSDDIKWSADGQSFFVVESNQIVRYALPTLNRSVVLSNEQLTPAGHNSPLIIQDYAFSADNNKILLFTNTQRVWRYKTRGDYYVYTKSNSELKQLGTTLPPSSLMFAKFSPDSKRVAYVSQYNLFSEDLASGTLQQLTKDGNRKYINGTFDWVYEEEFDCRDGFRWGPDSHSIAYWQVDARQTRDFYMINNTDSVYSRVIPVEYPKVGENPSAVRIGVINIDTQTTKWMSIEGDSRQHYLVRLAYIPGTNDLIVQQLNRKQNESKLIRCHADSGMGSVIYAEQDSAWIDLMPGELQWLSGGKEFLWTSESDGWRHYYRISADGKTVTNITKGDYDVIEFKSIDHEAGYLYYTASPDNATQQYLYRSKLTGKGKAERVTPPGLTGTHDYNVAPKCKFAIHFFSNTYTVPVNEIIRLPAHESINPALSLTQLLPRATQQKTTEFFKIRTAEGVEMDGWMVKPARFDSTRRYPVVFYVYTEPAATLVKDEYGIADNELYNGSMRDDGYLYIALDNRGTPAPKGRAWRKSIYRKVGKVNIDDQAMAAKEILKWPFVDPTRVAVWGWSGGASATLNLLFRYPEIYKTGIAVAAVANQLTYDNIYQERYMGLPQENYQDFIEGSPITYARNLQGNLLYIHGTGDDNVHYQNAEMLINELVKANKQFQFMAYPNRSHSISEGEGTREHLSTLYTQYLRRYCPPGPR